MGESAYRDGGGARSGDGSDELCVVMRGRGVGGVGSGVEEMSVVGLSGHGRRRAAVDGYGGSGR